MHRLCFGYLFFNRMCMKNLNRVSLLGHLVATPELHETKNGIPVAHFAVATNRRWKDAQGKTKGETDFHRIVAWRKLGELCEKYLAKGSSVYLEGYLKNHSYETQEGEKRFTTEIIARDVNILTWKKTRDGQVDPEVESLEEEDVDTEETEE